MYERQPSIYGNLVEKSVKDIRWLLDTQNKDHPIETQFAKSEDPLTRYLSIRMKEKRLKGHNMEYVFKLPPTAENFFLITRTEDYEK